MTTNFSRVEDPLSKLNSYTEGKYDFEKLTYPRRIDNIQSNGHYMNFYIYMHMASAYLDSANGKAQYSLPKRTTQVNPVAGQTFTNANESLVIDTNNPITSAYFRAHYRKITSAISLYIPDDSISFVSKPQWDKMSLTEAGGTPAGLVQTVAGGIADIASNIKNGEFGELLKTLGLYGGIAGAGILSGIGQEMAALEAKLKKGNVTAGTKAFANLTNETALLGAAGIAINPQYLVLFKQIDFRKFAFRFMFTPSNANEAEDVRNIIKMFRFHALPEVAAGLGRFQLAPSVFDIDFRFKDQENVNIPKIATSFLTHVGVDYSPRGWSTHPDGMPIQAVLDLQFQESELITKEKVEEGY